LLSTIGTTYSDGSSDYETLASNGTTVLRDTQTHADGSKDVYSYGITGTTYYTEHDTLDAKGNLEVINRTNLNGTHTQIAYQAGLTLSATAGVADAFTGYGGDTFQLLSGAGQDTITDFHAGSAVGHDILQLSANADTSFASMEANHMINSSGTNTLITLSSTNSVLLQGISASSLTADNFKFS
jgi:hypothetical protein